MSKEANTEHLRAELKSLADTLEEVLSTSGDKSKEELSKLRSKAEKALQESRYRLGETGDAIARQTREAAARKRGSAWRWSNWKRKKQTFSSCS